MNGHLVGTLNIGLKFKHQYNSIIEKSQKVVKF